MLTVLFWRLEEICAFFIKIKRGIIKGLFHERKTKLGKWDFLFFREDEEWYSKEKLIAHAGGGHIGLDYTNSQEALNKSIAHGIRAIEVDVAVSADGQIICTHQNFQEIPTINAFLSKKQDGRFERMSLATCLQIMDKDNILIIDVKEKKDLPRVAEWLESYVREYEVKKEIVFQIFKEEDLGKTKNFPVLYNLTYTEDYQRATGFCLLNGIHAVSIYKERIYKDDTWAVLTRHNVKIFAHPVNSLVEYQELRRRGVAGVFTDFLSPKDICNQDINDL